MLIFTQVTRLGLERYIRDFRSPSDTHRLSQEEIVAMTHDGRLQEKLLERGRYFITSQNWVQRPVTKKDILYAANFGDIYVSYIHHSKNVYVSYIHEPNNSKVPLEGVSFGMVMKTEPGCARVNITYYGNDITDQHRHLASYLEHVLKVCPLAVMPLHVTEPMNTTGNFEQYFGSELNMSTDENVSKLYVFSSSLEKVSKL